MPPDSTFKNKTLVLPSPAFSLPLSPLGSCLSFLGLYYQGHGTQERPEASKSNTSGPVPALRLSFHFLTCQMGQMRSPAQGCCGTHSHRVGGSARPETWHTGGASSIFIPVSTRDTAQIGVSPEREKEMDEGGDPESPPLLISTLQFAESEAAPRTHCHPLLAPPNPSPGIGSGVWHGLLQHKPSKCHHTIWPAHILTRDLLLIPFH